MRFSNVIPMPYRFKKVDIPLCVMQKKVDEFFDAFFPDIQTTTSLGWMARFPSITVSESSNAVILYVDIPHASAQNINVTTQKNRIFITYDKTIDAPANGSKPNGLKQYQYDDASGDNTYNAPFTCGKFSRGISFPFDINPEKTKAIFYQGALTITIEKSEPYLHGSKDISITSMTTTQNDVIDDREEMW